MYSPSTFVGSLSTGTKYFSLKLAIADDRVRGFLNLHLENGLDRKVLRCLMRREPDEQEYENAALDRAESFTVKWLHY